MTSSYERMLAEMPRIAEAVRGFTSENVQLLVAQQLLTTLLQTPGDEPEVPLSPPDPRILTRALAAFDAAGDTRMHSEALAQALGLTTVYELAKRLEEFGVESLPNPFRLDGAHRRGYDRESIAKAAAEYVP